MSERQPLISKPKKVWDFTGHRLKRLSTPAGGSWMHRSREQTRWFLTSKAGHYSVLALVSLDVSCIFADFIITIFTCQKRNPESGWSVALEALGIVSLVFSCLFMAELIASIWAFGKEYFKSKFHCFDALVITAGFIIDILLTGSLEEVASLVIVLRLWRVFKIMEELSVGAQEEMEDLEEKLALYKRENRELRNEVERLRRRGGGEDGGLGEVGRDL